MTLEAIKRLKNRILWRETKRQNHAMIELRGRYSYGIENINLVIFSKESRLKIGSFCSIAGDVTVLLGGDHRTDWITTYPFGHIHQDKFPSGNVHGLSGHPLNKGDVIIEHDTWVGYGVTILSGVTLGTGCCIGARSVVTKSVPPYAIAAGNPAKVIRHRFDHEVIEILQRIAWWNLPDHHINKIIPMLQQSCCISLARKLESICANESQETK
jgi:acetyltransferase-like isoleucine patch superfamily enzyme